MKYGYDGLENGQSIHIVVYAENVTEARAKAIERAEVLGCQELYDPDGSIEPFWKS